MPRVVCVSDLHEQLPEIPACDILLIAGDLCFGLQRDYPAQQRFLLNKFDSWVRGVPADQVVVIAGNHDESIQQYGWPLEADACEYLEDSGTRMHGLNIWGTPWQPYFYSWAFNAPERHGEQFLAEKFGQIPDYADIVVCHGPPYGYGDRVWQQDNPGHPRVGSRALTDALRRVQPRLVVCGHIHAGYGQYRLHGTETQIVNAALVNHVYKPVNPPVVIDL